MLKPIVKRALPAPVWALLRRAAGRPPLPPAPPSLGPAAPAGEVAEAANIYEALYENHGKHFSDDDVVGAGAFDLIGRIELGLLLMEGLEPTDTVLDFGCGTGRLAMPLIPRLAGGHYIGTDVSQSMLDKAQARFARTRGQPPCRVSWIKQTTPVFPAADRSVDVICAFSVFTHIEHEDSYLYLVDALRVIRPGGRFIFSCLPMNLANAREVFLVSTRTDFRGRWSHVRNVTTSMELMEDIARLAGWRVRGWYAGDQPSVRLPDSDEFHGLGQSTCVLEAPGSGPGAARPSAAGNPARPPAAGPPEEIGRIELSWSAGAITLAPHFTGPFVAGGGERFHLYPSAVPDKAGSLTSPPYAALTVDPAARRAVVSVSRVVPGTYRYSVLARDATGDALSAAGATVSLFHRQSSRPQTFMAPPGRGRRWTVFDVVVEGGNVDIRPIGSIDDQSDETSVSTWSPRDA